VWRKFGQLDSGWLPLYVNVKASRRPGAKALSMAARRCAVANQGQEGKAMKPLCYSQCLQKQQRDSRAELLQGVA
jgi:hypothetical protein